MYLRKKFDQKFLEVSDKHVSLKKKTIEGKSCVIYFSTFRYEKQ